MGKNKITHKQTDKIRKAYIYSLSFMSLLTLFAVYVVTDAVLEHRSDSRIINYAGKQRMESQRLAKNVWRIYHNDLFSIEDSLYILEELKTSFQQFNTVQAQLQQRDIDSLRGTNPQEIKQLLNHIKPHYEVIVRTISPLLTQQSSYQSLLSERSLAQFNFHSNSFLEIMNQIVGQYVIDSENKQMKAIYKTFGLGVLFLL
nr:type IV pili methyl-accepting chemotaxis transducer N-terminal domain-containing protein [Thermoflexibacter sp.]